MVFDIHAPNPEYGSKDRRVGEKGENRCFLVLQRLAGVSFDVCTAQNSSLLCPVCPPPPTMKDSKLKIQLCRQNLIRNLKSGQLVGMVELFGSREYWQETPPGGDVGVAGVEIVAVVAGTY